MRKSLIENFIFLCNVLSGKTISTFILFNENVDSSYKIEFISFFAVAPLHFTQSSDFNLLMPGGNKEAHILQTKRFV